MTKFIITLEAGENLLIIFSGMYHYFVFSQSFECLEYPHPLCVSVCLCVFIAFIQQNCMSLHHVLIIILIIVSPK